MKLFLARFDSIQEVEIARMTEQFIVRADGTREKIHTDWYGYFPTRAEAEDWILRAAHAKCQKANKDWIRLQDKANALLTKFNRTDFPPEMLS
jgi:hypothetical protein